MLEAEQRSQRGEASEMRLAQQSDGRGSTPRPIVTETHETECLHISGNLPNSSTIP